MNTNPHLRISIPAGLLLGLVFFILTWPAMTPIAPAPAGGLGAALDARRREVAGLAFETCYIMGIDGSTLAQWAGDGESCRTSLGNIVNLARCGGCYLVHNHPDGSGLNSTDLRFAAILNLAGIEAVSMHPDGIHVSTCFPLPTTGSGCAADGYNMSRRTSERIPRHLLPVVVTYAVTTTPREG